MKIIKRWFFTFAAFYFFATSGLTLADDVELRWHANIEMDLQGYNVYCGTQSRSYNLPISVGNVTNHVIADLDAGTTYFFALTAVDNAGNESGYSSEVSYTIPVPDTLAPTIAITAPTVDERFRTVSNALSLGGTAGDDRALQTVIWSASDGQNGTATGTNSWSIANLALAEGDTTITVTALDTAGNQGQDVITVSYTAPDTTAPSVVISSPTSGDAYTSDLAAINLAGSASDNVAVSQVTWSTSDGQSGTATGTSSWSIVNLALSEGDTTITVTAMDTAGNQAAELLTVTRINDLTLSVNAYKTKGKKFAGLTWSGGNSTLVDVYRDGSLIPEATGTQNDGEYIHGPFSAGKPATYHLCEDGTSNCSNRVTVSW
jgi:hypothetical protein